MAIPPDALDAAALDFLNERHLATLTTVRPDGSPHVVPVGFTFDPAEGVVRVISFATSRKVRNLVARPDRAVVCQVDGGRWLSLEGPATVNSDAGRVASAVQAYTARYGPPSPRPDRVVIEIAVDRVLGRGQGPGARPAMGLP